MFAQAAYYLDACGRKGQNCHICHCIWELYSVTLSCKYKYKIFLLHLEAENSLSQDIYLHKYSLSSTNNILHIIHTIQDWSVTDVQNNTPVLDSHASNREWRKHLLLMITAVKGINMKHDCHHNLLMFIQMTKIQDQACDECFCNEWKIAPLKKDNTSFSRHTPVH